MIVVLRGTAHQVCNVRGNQEITALGCDKPWELNCDYYGGLCRYAVTHSRASTIVASYDWSRTPSSSLARATKAVPERELGGATKSQCLCGDNIGLTNSALRRRFPVFRASPMNG